MNHTDVMNPGQRSRQEVPAGLPGTRADRTITRPTPPHRSREEASHMEQTQRVEDAHRADPAPAPRPRSVPSDWFLDPADPQAGVSGASLEDLSLIHI